MAGPSIFDPRECPASCPCNCHRLFSGLPAREQRRVCISCPRPQLAREGEPYGDAPPSAFDAFHLRMLQAGVIEPQQVPHK